MNTNRATTISRLTRRGRRARGFTIVEMLVVLAILVFLAALLAPTYFGVRAEALAVMCGHNLREISQGFATYKGQVPQQYFGRTALYPIDLAWPAIPGKMLNEWELFRCPAEPRTSPGGGQMEFHSAEGWAVPFGPGSCCQVHRGPGPAWGGGVPATPENTTDYGFEDIGGPNSTGHGDADFDDCVVRIVDQAEEGQIIFGTASYHNAIYSYGQLLYQLPSVSGVLNPPLRFPLPAGQTNYGYNSKISDPASEASIVAVDYPQAVANRPGEDVSTLLGKALRHNGTVNVLAPDGSVRRTPFSQIDPAIQANRLLWGK